jgi:hypothetical protein
MQPRRKDRPQSIAEFIALLDAPISAMPEDTIKMPKADKGRGVDSDPDTINVIPVDLGLPSGTLWADRNVGADSPEDYGDYFAWGETEPKSTYSWSNYKWCKGVYSMTKYCTERLLGYNGFTDGKTTLEPADDAATQNLGSNWRMPTKAECEELENNCTWKLTTRKRKKGYKVTGPNGKSIFLPAAGHTNNSHLDLYYWSSSLMTFSSEYAYCLHLRSVRSFDYDRMDGRSVRAVAR